MKNSFSCYTGAIFLAGILAVSGNAFGQATKEVKAPITHTVNAEVGLVVRKGPSSNTKKLGSLSYGERVKVVGEKVSGPKGGIIASLIPDSEAANTYWVKIREPIAGYVIYMVDENPRYYYLQPGKHTSD